MLRKNWNNEGSMRAKVEHCFHVVTCLFKHRKTPYGDWPRTSLNRFTLFGFAQLGAGALIPGWMPQKCCNCRGSV